MYGVTRYVYAVCGSDAQIRYSPCEFFELEKYVESIAIIPRVDELVRFEVVKAGWEIDGITERK